MKSISEVALSRWGGSAGWGRGGGQSAMTEGEKSTIKGDMLEIKQGGAVGYPEWGVTEIWASPRAQRAFFGCNSERGAELSPATGHWQNLALKAESTKSSGLPQRKTTNELNSVETHPTGIPETRSSGSPS